jgi:hypothetical protein
MNNKIEYEDIEPIVKSLALRVADLAAQLRLVQQGLDDVLAMGREPRKDRSRSEYRDSRGKKYTL